MLLVLSVANAAAQEVAQRSVLVKVFDGEQQPVSEAHVKLTFRNAWALEERSVRTDEAGHAIVAIPADAERTTLNVFKSGYVPKGRRWHRLGEEIPDLVTFSIQRGITIGGEVQNEKGEPIEGAQVALRFKSEEGLFYDESPTSNMFLLTGTEAPTTDADGRWSYSGVPEDAEVFLSVTHPSYDGDLGNLFRTQYHRASQRDLREQTALAKLSEGNRLSGQIVDAANRPLRDAVVIARLAPPEHSMPLRVTTNADGSFVLPAGPKAYYNLVVWAKGYAPEFRSVLNDKNRLSPIKLGNGRPLRLRVVDADDRPLRGAVGLVECAKVPADMLYWPTTLVPSTTNADGQFEWLHAPDDEFEVGVGAPGFKPATVKISPNERDEVTEVKLEPLSMFGGRVIDRQTREPIDHFFVAPIQPGQLIMRHLGAVGKNGSFQLRVDENDVRAPDASELYSNFHLYLEHAGHRSILTEESFNWKNPKSDLIIEMDPVEPISGTVVDVEGAPVRNATVTISESSSGLLATVELQFGVAVTDGDGKFQLPAPPGDYALIVRSPAGFLQQSFRADQLNVAELKLKPWSVISGVVLDREDRPCPNQRVLLHARGFAFMTVGTTTDRDGTFRFARVPDEKCTLIVHPNLRDEDVPEITRKFTPKPGEEMKFDLKFE